MDVIVGLYQGSKSWEKAEKVGLTVVTAAEAAKAADIIMMLVNDEKRANLYKESIEPNKGNCTCLCTWNWRRKMEQIFPMHTTIFQIKPALLIM